MGPIHPTLPGTNGKAKQKKQRQVQLRLCRSVPISSTKDVASHARRNVRKIAKWSDVQTMKAELQLRGSTSYVRSFPLTVAILNAII